MTKTMGRGPLLMSQTEHNMICSEIDSRPDGDLHTMISNAKEFVEEGWIQGQYVSERGVCLMGSVTSAREKNKVNFVNEAKLYDLIDEELAARGYSKGANDWNDEPNRTKKEVLELLDAVERRYFENKAKAELVGVEQ